MEYKLNKVDTELRQRIEDTTKRGIIHRKQSIKVNPDKKKNSREDKMFRHKLKNVKKHEKKFSVDAYKVQDVKVEAIKEKTAGDNTRGVFIDTKK